MKSPSDITLPAVPGGSGAKSVLKVLLVLSVAVPLLLFTIASWLNYDAAMADAARDLGRTGDVAREHAARLFDGLDQVSDRVNDVARELDAAQIRASERQVHETLARIVANLPQVQSVLLAGADGHPLASAAVFPVPAAVDLRARDYFSEVIDGYRGKYVSGLQFGDVNRQVFFGLSRTWTGLAGEIKGVIDVAVSPAAFGDFYRVLIGDGAAQGSDVAMLVRADGQTLVRYPPITGPPPKAVAGGAFFTAIAADPEAGTYIAASAVDAARPERIYAYRHVPGFPLYVVAGRSRSAILGGWLMTLASHLVFGVPATVGLVALAWTALVRTRREEEALTLARLEMRRRETAEQTLLRAQRLEAVGQMTGGVAHDFNNLLTIIVGNAELLERRPDDADRVRRLARNVITAAQRGAAVTQKLLAFSRRQLVRPQTLNLNGLLEQMSGALEQAAQDRHRVELVLDPALDTVRLDPAHFEAAILNLVSNARDAMVAGGPILIRTENMVLAGGERPDVGDGAWIRLTVTDTGSGMDASTMARAIEPFVTTKDVGKGTGLGLSQVYGFVKQAGGDVQIASVVGRGTTVELIFPRALDSEAVARPDPDIVPLRQARSGEVVLVVEDEPSVREVAVECLAELGYATITAADARTALERLREGGRIDLLFSDVVMPGGMNGVQLTVEARRLRPNLRVLLTSGYAAPEMGRDLPEDVPLLTKPYDRQELAARLQSVLGG